MSDGGQRRLFLIDGPSLVYRAFFALPEAIATAAGEPTNAIFGFASMLVKIATDYGTSPTIVAWDAGTSGRTDVYPQYKAQRQSRPDLLREQWPAMAPLVEAFGYRNVSVEGCEADDVIASIVERALAADPPVPVTIVTGDRDAFQLIDGDGVVEVLATARGITDTKLYDRDAVIERYGIPPELIPDYYGLKGDTSDNIPGVPGVGEKTAAELIARYGSLEGVLDSVDEIKGAKRKENLRENAELARISKQLATMHRDLDVGVDVSEEFARDVDRSQLRETLRRWELRDPLRRMEPLLAPDGAGAAATSVAFRAGSVADLAAFGEGEIAIVVRAGEPEEGQLFAQDAGWRFAAECAGAVIAGDCDGPGEVVEALARRPVVAHDAKSLGTVPATLAFDTMLGAYLLDPARRGYPLAELCEEAGIAVEADDPLAAEAAMLAALAAAQRARIDELDLAPVMDDIELPLVPVLREMELDGIHLDIPRLQEITARVREETAQLEARIHELAGEPFTIGSPQQLSEVLFARLGLTRGRRGKTGYSTDARVLQAIRDEHEIVPAVERWRELSTLIKTYLDVLPGLADENSRIHTTFLQAVAQTGRLSSTNPNLQNVPIRTELGREIRGCFTAQEGRVLVSSDYSQIELRVLAHIAEEPALMEIFARGEDVHTATASRVFGLDGDAPDAGMRSKAKMINYGIVYGLSDFGLADRLNIPRAEAKEFIDAYLERFPRVAAFMQEVVEQATRDGYVATLWGRRRPIPELSARNAQVRMLGERLAVNTVVQGTAADVIKLAMIRCHEALAASGLATKLLLTIHDELLFEAPQAEQDAAVALAREQMCAVWGDREPALAVDVGAGHDWLGAK
ncbi:MAG TPA: DNA polymerase I [Solirubrobacteraceae bacterium]|nr:DNA polymerase I [Solirubrobacteraceae bacterium]